MSYFKYAATNEAVIYQSIKNGKGIKPINRILLGTYVRILDQQGEWYNVATAGPNGWMRSQDLSDEMGLKIFFLDVGQGDGSLIEVGNYKILVDGGPNNSMHNYLTKWQYKYLIDKKEKIHIDFLIISHFDIDHYKGFIKIINDQNFTFGTIIHPGILKFAGKTNTYNSGLGETFLENSIRYLTNIFDDLLALDEQLEFNRDITAFIKALRKAEDEGRIGCCKRYVKGQNILNETIESNQLVIEALAPFTEYINDKEVFVHWNDDGKTINGHSLVIKLSFGERSVLLGGDLNTFSQEYLMKKYGSDNPFEVDVAKSCHHGSSDFSEDFMKLTNPYATIISSGDNEGHAHPRADAIGCAGKYSRGSRPLVYSTELARSSDMLRNKILYGMINMRSNGKDIYISQMKEVKKESDLWDSYTVG